MKTTQKIFWVLVIVVLSLGVSVFLRGIKNKAPGSSSTLSDMKCLRIVNVSDEAMEPVIKSGSKLTLSKCFKDKNNIPVGTIVLFEENKTEKLGRIAGRFVQVNMVYYKITRDSRPGETFSIPESRILATDEK